MIEVLFTESAADSILDVEPVEQHTRNFAENTALVEWMCRNLSCIPLKLIEGDISDPISNKKPLSSGPWC